MTKQCARFSFACSSATYTAKVGHYTMPSFTRGSRFAIITIIIVSIVMVAVINDLIIIIVSIAMITVINDLIIMVWE